MLQPMRSSGDLCQLHGIKDVCVTDRLGGVDTTPYGHYTRYVFSWFGPLWAFGVIWIRLAVGEESENKLMELKMVPTYCIDLYTNVVVL